MVNLNPPKKMVCVIAGLLVLSLSLSSCDTLREKFTRKKKGADEDQIQPILEPEEYPNPVDDPEKNYIENYQLIKAWYSDMWTAINDRETEKYTHYIINEVKNHITEMKKLVDAPTQVKLTKLSTYLDYYSASLDRPAQMRNYSLIESDLREFDRFMRDHLRDDKIQGHFVKAMPVSS